MRLFRFCSAPSHVAMQCNESHPAEAMVQQELTALN